MTEDSFRERLVQIIGGRSQKEFADSVGEIPKKVNDYVLGTSKPGWGFLVKLAEHGYNVNWLLTGEGPVYVEQSDVALPIGVQGLIRELKEHPELADGLLDHVRLVMKSIQTSAKLVGEFDKAKSVLKRRKKGSE